MLSNIDSIPTLTNVNYYGQKVIDLMKQR